MFILVGVLRVYPTAITLSIIELVTTGMGYLGPRVSEYAHLYCAVQSFVHDFDDQLSRTALQGVFDKLSVDCCC